jgi:hypothetical protein
MTPHTFADKPLITAIDSVIGADWSGIQHGGPLPSQSVQEATTGFVASDLFTALWYGDLVCEVVPRGTQGWADATPRIILPKTFWVAAVFAIRRDPPIVGERVFVDRRWKWRQFTDPMIRAPVMATEPPPSAPAPTAPPPAAPAPSTSDQKHESGGAVMLAEKLRLVKKGDITRDMNGGAQHILVMASLGPKAVGKGFTRTNFYRTAANIWEE